MTEAGNDTFLGDIPAFRYLSERELEDLSSQCEPVHYEKDEIIIHRGDPGDAMYIIREGRATAKVLNPDGEQMLVAQLRPRDFFGEMALLTGETRTADVIAESELDCLRIRREPFLAFLKQNTAVASFLTAILGQRLLEGENIKSVGNYRLVGELGAGGAAMVFEGRHKSLGTTVAIKMLSHELVFDEQFVTRFKAESRIMASLDHLNIVNVLDYEEAYATFFITMEKVDGTDLARHMKRRGRLSYDEVRSILAQIALALHYAHGRGIVHRDVKPGNILVEPNGRVKLMDFGIAKAMTEGDLEYEPIVGTPKYMSPEQCMGQTLDGRSDIYSLGLVGHELLTGKLPFEPTGAIETLRQQREALFVSPRFLASEVPHDLDELIRRMTARRPEDRFQTGFDVAAYLDDVPPTDASATRTRSLTLTFHAEHEARINGFIDRMRSELARLPGAHLTASDEAGPNG